MQNNGTEKKLLKDTDDSVIKGLSECCHNFLKGNVPTTKQKIKKLNKYKRSIRQMVNQKIAIKTKRRIMMTQMGGFIVPLLSILAPVISGIIGSIAG